MISAKAQDALAKIDHYPFGDVREWSRKNWNEAVAPYMDEFIAAVKDRAHAVSEEYFDETSPLFLFSDVKVMDGLVRGMSGKSAREKSEIMSEVFAPLGQKWMDLLSAVNERVGACAEVRTFKTKLALVADSLKLMFVETELETHMQEIWDQRRAMIRSFGALRNQVCPIPSKDRRRKNNPKYCLDNKALAAMFRVTVKTITRWKDESNTTEEARQFRMGRESVKIMQGIADRYQITHPSKKTGSCQVQFSDNVDYSKIRTDH